MTFRDDDRAFRRAERMIVPRYIRSVLAIRALVSDFDAASVLRALDFEPMGAALAEGVTEATSKPAVEAVRDAYRDTRKFLLRKITEEALDALALQHVNTRALRLASSLTRAQRAILREVLAEAIRENITGAALANRIRNVIGLTRESAQSLVRWERDARAAEVSEEVIERESTRRANRLVRSRAKTIARTEMASARSNATMSAWKAQQAAGELSPETFKQWMARDGCPVCEALQAQGPIPLRDAWQHGTGSFQNPPAHPNCFPPETPITTRWGAKRIEHIAIGDEVLTHRGRWRKVTALNAITYHGDLVVVHAMGDKHPVRATPEHPFHVGDFGDPPVWTAAKDLAHGAMVLCFPGYRWREREKNGDVWDAHFDVPIPVTTTHEHYFGPVHNFAVDEDESYVAGGMVVHNCRCAVGLSFDPP